MNAIFKPATLHTMPAISSSFSEDTFNNRMPDSFAMRRFKNDDGDAPPIKGHPRIIGSQS